MSEGRKVAAIMRIIPHSIRDKTQWDMDTFAESSDAVKKWIIQKTRNLTRSGYDSGAKQVHSLLEEYDELPEGLQDELHALGDVSEDTLCAFVRKRMANFKRGGDRFNRESPGPRAEAREAPPRDVRDLRCSNCGEKGHISRDC